MRHGRQLGSRWSAPVLLRLDDGREIALLLDAAVVSGGRHWSWTESWEEFCRDEPTISASLPTPPPEALVSVSAWLLEAGDRMVLRGAWTEVSARGGYRVRGRMPAFHARLAFSLAEPEPHVRPHTVWAPNAPTRLERLRRWGRDVGFAVLFFVFVYGGAFSLVVGAGVGIRALLRGLGL
ncbi:MAG: hypothetical protein JJ863_05965 [Deltaproteobacteria bacterium]|nr:hypothetical protein [Deltaproteobacteria bacterium]